MPLREQNSQIYVIISSKDDSNYSKTLDVLSNKFLGGFLPREKVVYLVSLVDNHVQDFPLDLTLDEN